MSYKIEYKGDYKYIKLKDNFISFRVELSTSNCKVLFIAFLGRCLSFDSGLTIKAMKQVLERETFFVHLMNKEYIELLNKHFIQIYYNEVPIRSSGSMQYHALYFSDTSSQNKVNFIKENGLENKE